MEKTSGGETMLQGGLFEEKIAEASQGKARKRRESTGNRRRAAERRDWSGDRRIEKALGLTLSISVSSS